jgi:hypothetical protein
MLLGHGQAVGCGTKPTQVVTAPTAVPYSIACFVLLAAVEHFP